MKRKISLVLVAVMVISMILGACESQSQVITTGSLKGNVSLDVETDIAPTSPEDPADIDVDLNFELPERDFSVDVSGVSPQEFLTDAAKNFSQEDLEKLKEMSLMDLAKLIVVRKNLMADLQYVFEKTGIAVKLDEKTGEANLDATILFDVNEYAVSQEGKDLLRKFMKVYTFVLCHEKYSQYVSGMVIEGHTDSSGEYEYNVWLSQARADAVLEYILSDECGECPDSFRENITATGYAWDQLVYDENGEEDMDASRRVTFRFLFQLP